jgi:hypothetical protein
VINTQYSQVNSFVDLFILCPLTGKPTVCFRLCQTWSETLLRVNQVLCDLLIYIIRSQLSWFVPFIHLVSSQGQIPFHALDQPFYNPNLFLCFTDSPAPTANL